MSQGETAPPLPSLGRPILLTVLGALLINGVMYAAGWAGPAAAKPHPPLVPAGWVIGTVWLVLLALLALAYGLLRRAGTAGRRLAPWVAVLILGCLAYPFYTGGLRHAEAALTGNLVTIVLAAFLAGRAVPVSGLAATLILPTVLWVCFATFAVFVG